MQEMLAKVTRVCDPSGMTIFSYARVSTDGQTLDARVSAYGERAIITVNARSPYRRNRFSIAHELGHWCHHRGACLVCRAEEGAGREAKLVVDLDMLVGRIGC